MEKFKKTYVHVELQWWREACAALRQKWVMRDHLEGLLWNSKNSFTGNWISNDTKWKWSCESVPLLRKPRFLQSRWDTEATREGSKGKAYGNKWHRVKITIHCALLNFMAAWWGPGLSDMMPLVCIIGRWKFSSTLFKCNFHVIITFYYFAVNH